MKVKKEDKKREEKRRTLAGEKTLMVIGNSVLISLPVEWLEQHGIDRKTVEKLKDAGKAPKIGYLANKDLTILSPESQEEFYKEHTSPYVKEKKEEHKEGKLNKEDNK